MSKTKPVYSLDGSCTVVYENKLYSYSPEGFQSLALEDGAKWKKLEMGVKATGATCVGSTSQTNPEPGFFVVGGKGDSDAYTGLQKYTYSTGKWSTITPTDLVTKNRQWHSSQYLPATDTILVYAGSQNGNSGPSTETFTILAKAPWTAKSYPVVPPPVGPPPGVQPILGSWSNGDAFMIGGGSTPFHSNVYWFNPDGKWRQSGASLASGTALNKDRKSMQAVVVSGSDNSKSLITFDLSVSPNKVTRVVVQDATGKPVLNAPAIKSRSIDGLMSAAKRDLTLKNWPEYNSTLAPETTREGFAMAQDANGMVVFSGGNKDEKEPIALFDASENGWLNATNFFLPADQKMLAVSSTTSSATSTSTTFTSTSSSTSISSSITSTTSSAAAITDSALPAASTDPSSTDSGPSSNAILGITLGSIAGFLLLLGLLLLCLRRRKQHVGHSEGGRANGTPSDEKDMSAFNNNAYSPPGHFRGHRAQPSAESYSSVAILMGRMNKEKSGLSRKPSNDTTRSSLSSLHKQFKSTISKPIPQTTVHPSFQGQDERGVAFAPTVAEPRARNGPMEANDGTRRSSGWNRYWSGGSALQLLGFGSGKRNTAGSEQSSRYSENSANPRVTQDSATVPPLNFEGRPNVNSVNSGSPVVAQYTSKLPLTEGMKGTIERPVSEVSALSSGYSSGIPESVNEVWDPTQRNKPWGTDRAPSSAYAPSAYETSAPSHADERTPPSGVSKQPQLAMASTSDMSWLNLGDQSRV